MITLARMRSVLSILLLFGLLAPQAQADSVLRDMRGQITTFDEQQVPGQWTVVMIWASDCHVCNQESGQYAKFHAQHAGHAANIVGMSIDGWSGRENAQAFIDRNGVNFPNLIGDAEAVAGWYAMETGEPFIATPTFVVFGPEGEIRAAQAGAVPPKVIEDFIKTNG